MWRSIRPAAEPGIPGVLLFVAYTNEPDVDRAMTALTDVVRSG